MKSYFTSTRRGDNGNIAYEMQDEVNPTQTDQLFLRLKKCGKSGTLTGQKTPLFAELDPASRSHLLLAVDFYQRLNEKTDAELIRCDFSREEAEEGLNRVLDMCGVESPLTLALV